MNSFSKILSVSVCLLAAQNLFAAKSFSEVATAASGQVDAAINAAVSASSSAPAKQASSSSSSLIKEIKGADFKKEVLQYKGLVVVDFGASWCDPCKNLIPFIETIAKEYQGRVKIVKMDQAAAEDVFKTYGISQFPTVGLFKNGSPVFAIIGLADIKKLLRSKINSFL